ncbi:threonine synthase [Paenibacillus sp. sptzw28]|uniref:threonine synthase n=1 Tax=Paenibacillus sp. sptzw28 TaxID=715179 RepID=UPI001C6E063E|nr:threonine synthase [Paenibacillus sp. sptzw28]QYR21857.1 threonine synthase [Paenibacillus sp. sptzw28]
MRFLLACRSCGKQMPFAIKAGSCKCGGTLLVAYDLERIRRTLTKEKLKNLPATMWRYNELLPIENEESIISLGEGWTPLVPLNMTKEILPGGKIWVKREEQNPTGSFKSRGFSAALSIANEYGIRKVAVNSNGNAASALAAYAGYAGMEAYVFLPLDCPGLIVKECMDYGARTFLVDGLIHDAGRIVKEGEQEQGWYNVGTLKEPGRVEGKKTMGLEIAEQLQWKLPDVIIYPTGGGSGIIGMWNAFLQLKELGFVEGDLPRMVSVQEQGCQPLVDAVRNNAQFKPQCHHVYSSPTGMRVPDPPDGQLVVSVLLESGGTAVSVTGTEIQQAQKILGKQGISSSPEGAAALAGLFRLIERNFIRSTDEVVLFNTSHSLKYLPWDCIGLPIVKTYRHWVSVSSPSELSV